MFCVGVSNGSFGTLAAVYADRVGLVLTSVALFASLPILAGAVSQIPIGMLSDRMDRRKVLIGVAAAALAVDAAFVLVMPDGRWGNLVLASAFGAAIYAMYPIIVAHANDHAADGNYIQVSGGLLMVFGLGSIAGPALAGVGMTLTGSQGLFFVTGLAHVAMIAFAVLRIRARAPVAGEVKVAFKPAPTARGSTPETAALAVGREAVAEQAKSAAD